MARSIVYKALKPKRWLFWLKIVLTVCCFSAAAAMIIAACSEYAGNGDYGSLAGVGLVCTGLAGVIAVMVIKSLKNEKRFIDSREQLLASLGNGELQRLEEEAAGSPKYFGCIYLLSEYFFVPKASLLIRYTDIGNYKSIYHSTNGMPDGVFVEVYDKANVKCRFSVNKWREYQRDYNGYMSELDRRMNGGVKREREMNGYNPVNS
ncbi:MAG: conjugal transfer protein TraG N-terminal domain-containing protein [Ruminococcus sp.]|nr:conjugal transfer protein TraG N-terminal domain-containing protein [Ruminococcus sp.]